MPGLVVVQTFNPDHYAVRRAQNHDYQGFYEDEISLRKGLRYPPYVRLINLQISSANRDRGRSGIDIIGRLAKQAVLNNKLDKVEILGPVEAPVSKIRGRYRWQILLKGGAAKGQIFMVDIIRAEAAKCGLEVKVDVDPMNFM
jgi:primosomal protein N' (replication factor Y)